MPPLNDTTRAAWPEGVGALLSAHGYALLEVEDPIETVGQLLRRARVELRIGELAKAHQTLTDAAQLASDRPRLLGGVARGCASLALVFALDGRATEALALARIGRELVSLAGLSDIPFETQLAATLRAVLRPAANVRSVRAVLESPPFGVGATALAWAVLGRPEEVTRLIDPHQVDAFVPAIALLLGSDDFDARSVALPAELLARAHLARGEAVQALWSSGHSAELEARILSALLVGGVEIVVPHLEARLATAHTLADEVAATVQLARVRPPAAASAARRLGDLARSGGALDETALVAISEASRRCGLAPPFGDGDPRDLAALALGQILGSAPAAADWRGATARALATIPCLPDPVTDGGLAIARAIHRAGDTVLARAALDLTGALGAAIAIVRADCHDLAGARRALRSIARDEARGDIAEEIVVRAAHDGLYDLALGPIGACVPAERHTACILRDCSRDADAPFARRRLVPAVAWLKRGFREPGAWPADSAPPNGLASALEYACV